MKELSKALTRNAIRWAIILVVAGIPVFGYLPAAPHAEAPRPAVVTLTAGCARIAPAPGLAFDCK